MNKDSITIRKTTEFKKWPEPLEIRASWSLADTVRELREEWAKELCFDDCMCIAYALYDAGFTPAWSSDLSESIICGFGDTPFGFKYELLVKHTEDDGFEIVPWPDVKAAMDRTAKGNAQ
jgi:hypothetical protein